MLNIIKQNKNLIIIIGIIIIGSIYWILNIPKNQENVTTDTSMLEIQEENKEEDKDIIVVHVTGAIKKPGIVRLEEGSRIEDAIQAAGGLTEDSDISDVNLAYILDDGIKLRIPTIDDKNKDNYISENSGENIILEDNLQDESNSLININKATQTELETLPGIGPSLSNKIVEYREKNGKFSKIEDIKNVTGIGDSKYANIKDLITV